MKSYICIYHIVTLCLYCTAGEWWVCGDGYRKRPMAYWGHHGGYPRPYRQREDLLQICCSCPQRRNTEKVHTGKHEIMQWETHPERAAMTLLGPWRQMIHGLCSDRLRFQHFWSPGLSIYLQQKVICRTLSDGVRCLAVYCKCFVSLLQALSNCTKIVFLLLTFINLVIFLTLMNRS